MASSGLNQNKYEAWSACRIRLYQCRYDMVSSTVRAVGARSTIARRIKIWASWRAVMWKTRLLSLSSWRQKEVGPIPSLPMLVPLGFQITFVWFFAFHGLLSLSLNGYMSLPQKKTWQHSFKYYIITYL